MYNSQCVAFSLWTDGFPIVYYIVSTIQSIEHNFVEVLTIVYSLTCTTGFVNLFNLTNEQFIERKLHCVIRGPRVQLKQYFQYLNVHSHKWKINCPRIDPSPNLEHWPKSGIAVSQGDPGFGEVQGADIGKLLIHLCITWGSNPRGFSILNI